MKSDEDSASAAGEASTLIQAMERAFGNMDGPVSISSLARVYGVIATQHEALISCFALALQDRSSAEFSDRVLTAQKRLQASVDALTSALQDLAMVGMSEDERRRYKEGAPHE